jgi:hypothetical protein
VISIAKIVTRFDWSNFSDCNIRALFHDSEFGEQMLQNHLLCFLDRSCNDMLFHHISILQLNATFQFNKTKACAGLRKSAQDPTVLSRHQALGSEMATSIVA